MLGIATTAERQTEAQTLAEQLEVDLLKEWNLDDESRYPYLLVFDADAVSLCATGKKRAGPVLVDFLTGAVNHRRQFGGGQGQHIAKACGVSGGYKLYIADMTAGLGRDAFVLASLGCRVQMVERNPVVATLLSDGLTRARRDSDPEIEQIIGRLSLFAGESGDWLKQHQGEADVVYLDPMFPHSQKSAQVKKEMLAFRSVVGADEDSARLLESALDAARCRVVVKRPRKAPSIEGRKPDYALEGKSGRFDVYALRKLEPAS